MPLSVDKVCFHTKKPSRGSAHSKAFAQQTHKPVGLYPQKYLMRATGDMRLGFHTLRGRKFPHGNFRTSVFCVVRTQIVGETLVSRQSKKQQGTEHPHWVQLPCCCIYITAERRLCHRSLFTKVKRRTTKNLMFEIPDGYRTANFASRAADCSTSETAHISLGEWI